MWPPVDIHAHNPKQKHWKSILFGDQHIGTTEQTYFWTMEFIQKQAVLPLLQKGTTAVGLISVVGIHGHSL